MVNLTVALMSQQDGKICNRVPNRIFYKLHIFLEKIKMGQWLCCYTLIKKKKKLHDHYCQLVKELLTELATKK